MLGETRNHNNDLFSEVKKTDSLDKFLTAYEYERINYAILSSVKQLVDNYKDGNDHEAHDPYEVFQGEVRTILSVAPETLYDEWEMKNDAEGKVITKDSDFYKSFAKIIKDAGLQDTIKIDEYVANKTKYDLAYDTYKKYNETFALNEDEDKTAITKLVRDLKKLGFISGSFNKIPVNKDDFLAISYFGDTLQSQYESEVITKYKNALQNDEEKKLADDKALYQAYVNVYNSQKAKYANDYSAYETALSNASDTNIVFYNPEVADGKYGYVLNLLIGFSDEEKAIYDAVAESPKLTATQKQKALESLLTYLTAKDLRSSWVESNYGEYKDGVFTFGDRYVKTPALQTYQGIIMGAEPYTYHDSYDEEVEGHSYKSVKGNKVSFVNFFNNIVASNMGFATETTVSKLNGHSGKIDLTDEKLDTFKDLMFAYSTDPGSLSESKGYLYSPKTSKTTYVKEFADAAKRVVNAGKGAFEIVATEYGYHIILCSEVISASTLISWEDFSAGINGTDKNHVAYKFKEYQKELFIADNVTKITDKFFKDKLSKPWVDYYESNYEDLIPKK